MLTWHGQQVLNLQAAIGASQFGARMCFAPTENPADLWLPRTLFQVAEEIKAADEGFGNLLVCEAHYAEKSRGDARIAHDAWEKFTSLIAGRGAGQTGAPPQAALQSQAALIERLNGRVLADKTLRVKWVSEGLEEMCVSSLISEPIRARLKGLNNIRLELEKGSRPYFEAWISERGRDAVVSITTPGDQAVITERHLKLMCARALLLSDTQSSVMSRRFVPQGRVRLQNLALPPFASIEARCVDSLRRELERKKQLADFVRLIPQVKSLDAAFRSDVLRKLAKKIGERFPNLGAKLLAISAEIKNAANIYIKFKGWESYISAIKNAKADSLNGEGMADMKALARALDILSPLDRARRRKWVSDGMKKLGMPNPEEFFNSGNLDIDEMGGIYPYFEASKDGQFAVSAKLPGGGSLARVEIGVPRTHGPVTFDELQLLVARALMMGSASAKISEATRARHMKAKRGALDAPVPIVVMDSEGNMAAMGPLPLAGAQRNSFARFVTWLQSGARVMNPPRQAGLSVELQRQIREGEDAGMWQTLLDVPMAANVVFKYLNTVLGSEYDFTFETKDEGGRNIEIALDKDGRLSAVHVRLSRDDLQKLRGPDLIDILLRALFKRDLKDFYEEAARHEKDDKPWNLAFVAPPSNDPCIVSLEELREGFDLSPDVKLVRSCLRLLRAFRELGAPKSAGINIAGGADSGIVRNLSNALQAVAKAARISPALKDGWEDLLNIKRWHLQTSGVQISKDSLIVDAIPVNGVCLIHIHGDARGAGPSDWLYLLGAMAANPSFALRLTIDRREVIVGGRGDPLPHYGSIAGNRIFERFGVFDASAKMPVSIAPALPGGIPAERNPNFAGAPPDEKKKYVAALRWFANAPIPDTWRPTAANSRSEARRKYRLMASKWHDDVGPRLEERILFHIATGHWKNIFHIYEKEDL